MLYCNIHGFILISCQFTAVYSGSSAPDVGCRAYICVDAIHVGALHLPQPWWTAASFCCCRAGHRSWPSHPFAAPWCPRLPSHVGACQVARTTARHPCCPLPTVLAGQSLLAATWCIFCAHTYASLSHGLPLKHASS